MADNTSPVPENCTHDCSTCSSACSAEGEQKEPYGMFEKIESLVGEFQNDDVLEMLTKMTDELEKEEQ